MFVSDREALAVKAHAATVLLLDFFDIDSEFTGGD